MRQERLQEDEDGGLRWLEPDKENCHLEVTVRDGADGTYRLRVHVDPAPFMRHDRVNGRRFAEPVDCEFTGVEISTGSS